jgi:hypothetical protein
MTHRLFAIVNECLQDLHGSGFLSDDEFCLGEAHRDGLVQIIALGHHRLIARSPINEPELLRMLEDRRRTCDG